MASGTQPTIQQILLVEDNADARRQVRMHLASETRRTYVVWEAEGGSAALDHCRAHAPDCVLLDHTLPDMSYRDALRGIAGVIKVPTAVPVILLAEQDAEAIAAQALSDSIWDYIIKGALTPHSTRRSVHLALERAELVRELERHRAALAGGADASQRATAHGRQAAQGDTRATLDRMDDFLTIASHELRTPLTAIKGNIQLAIRRLSARWQDSRSTLMAIEKATELLRRTETQTDRLERLVGSLLDTLSVRRGQLDVHARECDFTAIVRTVVAQARQLAPDRQIRLTAPDTALLVHCDADRAQQALETYLDNALKYSPVDAPVDVIVCADTLAGVVQVEVCDRGPGVPPERRERIWERYQRVPGVEAQSGSGVGLGLGLYIVRSVIERHGGWVGVESRAGGGAVFWFSVPLRTATPGPSDAPANSETGSQLPG